MCDFTPGPPDRIWAIPGVKSGSVHPAGELILIIGGTMCGTDRIDDAGLLRAGGTTRVFDEVYAPSTLGIVLREFAFGHTNQLAAVGRAKVRSVPRRRRCFRDSCRRGC